MKVGVNGYCFSLDERRSSIIRNKDYQVWTHENHAVDESNLPFPITKNPIDHLKYSEDIKNVFRVTLNCFVDQNISFAHAINCSGITKKKPAN